MKTILNLILTGLTISLSAFANGDCLNDSNPSKDLNANLRTETILEAAMILSGTAEMKKEIIEDTNVSEAQVNVNNSSRSSEI